MSSTERANFRNPVIRWIDQRLPVFTLIRKEYKVFPIPRNINYFWNFGAIALFMLVVMMVTGIVMAMHYTADTRFAFDSVEHIMRDVNGGWLIRYAHINGASFLFIAVYIHIFRGIYYGSYKKPRELLWIFGVVIFLLLMGTAFIGHVLPWGQMSFWSATVITSLFSAIPLIGDSIVTLLWGGFSVDNPTLTRFFILHFLLPFIIVFVLLLHVCTLHIAGSNNPLGIDAKEPQDTLPFHPYYTTRDIFGLLIFLTIYAVFVFYMPNVFNHPDNYIPADPLVTPAHITPEWYFLPFYAMLRAITFDISIPLTDVVLINAKLGGVIAMFGSIILLFFLPWLDSHPVRSARFRPLFRFFLLTLVVDFIFLGYVGFQPADAELFEIPLNHLGLAATVYYYAFFLIVVPLLSKIEKERELPVSIYQPVLQADGPATDNKNE